MAEMNYASKGWAALNTVLGSIGTAGTTGVLGNLFGGANCACSENMMVNRYELGLQQENAGLKMQVALRDANTYTMSEMAKFRDYYEIEKRKMTEEINELKNYATANTATVGCIANQVNQLFALTKLVIPNASICPGWTTTAAAGA